MSSRRGGAANHSSCSARNSPRKRARSTHLSAAFDGVADARYEEAVLIRKIVVRHDLCRDIALVPERNEALRADVGADVRKTVTAGPTRHDLALKTPTCIHWSATLLASRASASSDKTNSPATQSARRKGGNGARIESCGCFTQGATTPDVGRSTTSTHLRCGRAINSNHQQQSSTATPHPCSWPPRGLGHARLLRLPASRTSGAY